MEILFYHLERKPLEAVLPGLLEKTLQRGVKAVVKTGSDERIKALDDLLWTYRDESFLPHGTEEDGRIESQPILLTQQDRLPPEGGYLFLVDGAAMPEEQPLGDAKLARIILIFDGNDPDALDAARAQWKALRKSSYALTYWQQNEQGRWEKRG
jgi:DNA polymerase III subunit chi